MRYFVTIAGREVEVLIDGDQVTVDGRTCSASLAPIPGTPLRQLMVDEHAWEIAIEPMGRGQWGLLLRGERTDVEVVDERTRHIRSLAGARGRRGGASVVRAPMPGLVVRVQVGIGDEVTAGAALVVLEAMKMENELKAPAPGVIGAVRVGPGEAVEKGQILIEFRDSDP